MMADKQIIVNNSEIIAVSAEGLTEEDTQTIGSRGFIGSKDRWGFLISDEFHKYLQLTPEQIEVRKIKEAERALKWVKMKKNWLKYNSDGPKYAKMKRRARKGIPDAVRGFAWYQLCNAEAVHKKYPDPYSINVKTVSDQVIDEVEN